MVWLIVYSRLDKYNPFFVRLSLELSEVSFNVMPSLVNFSFSLGLPEAEHKMVEVSFIIPNLGVNAMLDVDSTVCVIWKKR